MLYPGLDVHVDIRIIQFETPWTDPPACNNGDIRWQGSYLPWDQAFSGGPGSGIFVVAGACGCTISTRITMMMMIKTINPETGNCESIKQGLSQFRHSGTVVTGTAVRVVAGWMGEPVTCLSLADCSSGHGVRYRLKRQDRYLFFL